MQKFSRSEISSIKAFIWHSVCLVWVLTKSESGAQNSKNICVTCYVDQILDNLRNWWLEFLLLLVLHTSDWMRNEVSVRTVRTMVGFVKNRPTIWPTIVVDICQIRNGHYRHFGGGALTNFYQCPGLYQSLDIIWTWNNFLLHG